VITKKKKKEKKNLMASDDVDLNQPVLCLHELFNIKINSIS